MSSGFGLPDVVKPTKVFFAAGGDSMMEDEGLNPPLVRERWVDQSNIFLDADYRNQVNPGANTSQWIIGANTRNNNGAGGFFANRVKKFTPNYILASLYAPNINPRNNVLEFTINGTDIFRAIIPENNYTRLTTDYNNFPVTYPATYNVSAPSYAPLATELIGDPNDGIIDHILTAMNTAINISTGATYNPASAGYGKFTVLFSNGYLTRLGSYNSTRYRNNATGNNYLSGDGKYGVIVCTPVGGGQYIQFNMTGGNTFQKGLHAWGCSPIPKTQPAVVDYSIIYPFGPVQLQYSRYFDIIMPELTQFSKLSNAGSSVPMGLLTRIYTNRTQPIGLFDLGLDGAKQQQINMRKDYTLNYLTVEIRDEYGDLYEIPDATAPAVGVIGPKWPNSQGINIGMVCQL